MKKLAGGDGDVKIRDVMTRRAEILPSHATVQAAARKMRDLRVRILPVSENRRIAGTVSDWDITIRVTAEGRDPKEATVGEAMTPGIECCDADENLPAAAKLMQQKQVTRLAVLDDGHALVGIVSLGDLGPAGEVARSLHSR